MILVRAALLILSLLVVSCGNPPPSATDRVALDEFSIVTDASAWTAGDVSLSVANVGERAHTLVVSRADGEVVAATDIIDPDEDAGLSVDLEPGIYQLTCRIVVEGPDGQIFDHFEQGMHTTIEVEG